MVVSPVGPGDVVVGGVLDRGRVEWWALDDPQSAHSYFDGGLARHFVIDGLFDGRRRSGSPTRVKAGTRMEMKVKPRLERGARGQIQHQCLPSDIVCLHVKVGVFLERE